MKYSSKGQLLLASAAESLEKTRSSIILLYITGKTAIFLPIIFVGPLLLQFCFFQPCKKFISWKNQVIPIGIKVK